MSEARTDTVQERMQGATEAGGAGRHRGGAAKENAATQAHGRHRRPAQSAAA
ncbi:hypothetical protein ACQEVG_08125 [Streptomyces sp. CA-135486]|uniref:hypothetical protein n=1 Tax=Streptomyces sp. CA-135486 TaxID=3240049 RepID=UPI003D923771